MSGRTTMSLSNNGNSSDLFHHIYIYSNTFHTGVGNPFAVLQVGDGSYNNFNTNNLKNVYLINNIFVTDSSVSTAYMLKVFGLTYEDGTFTINNNSYYSSGVTLKVYWDETTYYTSSPAKWGVEPIFTNQQFVDETNGNFHLSSTSPCIDTGNSALVPSFDFDDVNRPQGAGYDIGAYEFLSGYYTTPPWDINNDGECSILDLILVSNHYAETGYNGWIREDVDDNGIVNILDLSLVSNHYGEIWYT